MQRTIKFRAWIDNKHLLDNDSVAEYLIANGVWFDHSKVKDRMIVMQYTGLKDKNGKEIYEGDIVHYSGQEVPAFTGYMVWRDKVAGFMFHDVEDEDEYRLFEIDRGIREVIGNIYENPDLLTKENL